jgi:hypothetical protein
MPLVRLRYDQYATITFTDEMEVPQDVIDEGRAAVIAYMYEYYDWGGDAVDTYYDDIADDSLAITGADVPIDEVATPAPAPVPATPMGDVERWVTQVRDWK